jgi:hypothetical protein
VVTHRDVVGLLLSQKELDDDIKDDEGKTPIEVCRNGEVGGMLQGKSRMSLFEILES